MGKNGLKNNGLIEKKQKLMCQRIASIVSGKDDSSAIVAANYQPLANQKKVIATNKITTTTTGAKRKQSDDSCNHNKAMITPNKIVVL